MKLYNILFRLKRYERLLRVPRQYANRVASEVDIDHALIMARSSARSPENVRALMQRHGVQTVEELIDLLPDQRYHRRPLARLLSLMRHITGAEPHNPDHRRYRMLKARGWFSRPDVHDRIEKVREFK